MSLHKSYVAEKAARPTSTYSSHDTQQQQLTEVPVASRTSKEALGSTKRQLAGEHLSPAPRNKLIVPSPAYATKPSANSTLRTGARSGNDQDEPSILPRSISSPYTTRLDSLASSRPPPPPPPVTGLLASSRVPVLYGSSSDNALGLDSTRKVLRRKAPSVEQYVSSLARPELDPKRRTGLRGDRIEKRSSKSLPGDFRDSNTDAFLGIGPSEPILPTMLPKRHSGELPPALIPELKALAAATASHRTASSTPHVPSVGSPSTQYSGSTGPWSSRDTTPTSISSCSPGIIQPSRAKTTSRLRKAIPSLHTRAESSRFGFKTPPAVDETPSASRAPHASKNDHDKHSLLQQYRNKQNRWPSLTSTPTPPTPKSLVNAKSSHPVGKVSSPSPENQGSEHKWGMVREPVPNVATPAEGPRSREIPRRPSRKGTADLDTTLSPVVQSNLSPQSLRGYRRRDSFDVGIVDHPSHDMNPGRDQDTDSRQEHFSHVAHLRHPLPRGQIDPASKSSKLPVTARTQEPAGRIVAAKDSGSQGSREGGRSTIGKISSRLGIFGRRSKLSHEDTTSVPENRDLRKGPAAGTGHEGYGKYARRGRKHSVGSGHGSRDRSTSTASQPSLRRKNSISSAGGSEIDDFVAQRLQPLVIPGGGGNDVRPDSDAPTVWPSFDRVSFASKSSLDLTRQLTSEPSVSVASDSRSMSVASVATDAPSTLALDTKSRIFSMAIPSQNYPAHAPPSLDGYTTSQSSLIQDDASVVSADQTLSRPTLRDLKKASKTGRMFRWNIFRSKASVGQSATEFAERDTDSMRMSVAVAATSVDKPIPYYALMDSENENDGEDNLQDLLEQIRESPSFGAEPSSEPQGLGLRQQYGQSVLLPSMPTLQQEDSLHAHSKFSRGVEGCEVQPTGLLSSISTQSTDHNRRRLPQVGRIPRVISRRDRQHKPAATSFSRPFQRDNIVDASNTFDNYATSVAKTKRPILGVQTDVLPSRPFFTPESGQAASAPAGPPSTRVFGDVESHSEFLVFSGKGYSGNSAASSSDMTLSMANVPPSTARRHHTAEDEIWNEYDDLLDQVMSPTGPDPARSAPRPSSGQLLAYAAQPQRAHARPESHLRLEGLHQTGHNAYTVEAPSLHLEPSPSVEAGADYRLRRSRIVSALQSTSSMSPSSPFSTSDRTLGYADHGMSTTDYGQPFGGTNVIQPGLLLSPSAHAPCPAFPKLPEVSHHQSTALLDIAERDHEGPVGQSDLRFAALMTSRWLSFGRVLFSPAHDLVQANTGQQVLVIDGLGNDDWSFYCAVTYPGAVVHDLKETDISLGSQGECPKEPWRAPPNYRRVELANLAERFPFPHSYFAVVVFRFPAAMSDTTLKMAFSECKRVLVPGGHLELSLLDLDMANMGTITRHAVRDLKARMISADPDVGLKPVGDNVQNMLGQRGFENLNRCVVGVPVAGKVAASSSGSRSSRSSRESTAQRAKEADPGSGLRESRNRRNDESDRSQQRGGSFSLSELVSDHSATSDEKITKMVAKVGRWWYTRTYEWAVLPGGDLKRSIWSDKRMLRECKARGSGFKLLIAYVQKPVETRRRTLSEPIRTSTKSA